MSSLLESLSTLPLTEIGSPGFWFVIGTMLLLVARELTYGIFGKSSRLMLAAINLALVVLVPICFGIFAIGILSLMGRI